MSESDSLKLAQNISFIYGLFTYTLTSLICLVSLATLAYGYQKKKMILQPTFVAIIFLLFWGSLGFLMYNVATYKMINNKDETNSKLNFAIGVVGKFL